MHPLPFPFSLPSPIVYFVFVGQNFLAAGRARCFFIRCSNDAFFGHQGTEIQHVCGLTARPMRLNVVISNSLLGIFIFFDIHEGDKVYVLYVVCCDPIIIVQS